MILNLQIQNKILFPIPVLLSVEFHTGKYVALCYSSCI